MKFISAILFSVLIFNAKAQEIPTYNLEQLENHIFSEEDVTYVVNFWATWCAPCVKELPHFEQLQADNPDIKVILVSLDFANMKESRLIPFVEKKKIQSEVIHFVEKDPNYWIPKISPKWSGSIPATLILNGKKGVNEFFETTFESTKELQDLLDQFTSN
jgi:thiol-disulfide isomerase/thioredoxin